MLLVDSRVNTMCLKDILTSNPEIFKAVDPRPLDFLNKQMDPATLGSKKDLVLRLYPLLSGK